MDWFPDANAFWRRVISCLSCADNQGRSDLYTFIEHSGMIMSSQRLIMSVKVLSLRSHDKSGERRSDQGTWRKNLPTLALLLGLFSLERIILRIDLEGFSLIPGLIYIDRWSGRPNGGRLLGKEKNSGKLVKIWSRVLLPLIGNVTVGFRWKALTADWTIGWSDLLKSPAKKMAQLRYFASRDTKDVTN